MPFEELPKVGLVPVIDELELGWRLGRSPLLAVTGTNGKTTVCALLRHALATSGISSVLGGNTEEGAPLSALADQDAPVVGEVSSYQLEGTSDLLPELAIFTNLRPEHLHRHGTMENYLAAKRKLFVQDEQCVSRAAVNTDEPWGRRLSVDISARGGQVITFGSGPNADVRVLRSASSVARSVVRLSVMDRLLEVETLPGRHNAENLAAAVAGCVALGMPATAAAEAMRGATGVPGRWERIVRGQSFDAIVDFAHTPDALEAVLSLGRELVAKRGRGRVHAVLCAGGGNNPAKRVPMGRATARLADRIIVTEGNGRGEPAPQVIAGLLEGIRAERRKPQVDVVEDRRDAIRAGLRGASAGDVVLILGRGRMPRLLSGHSGEGRPFDDRDVVAEELERSLQDDAVPTRA
jgi:UDP-N-acetylmuramoyl-L-alanyl-D-glutamate--2,6-diaminopimelate ligase